MISIDAKFLKHLVLIIGVLLDVINGKYKNVPGERQHMINLAARTKRQIDYIIREAETEESLNYIRRGFVREATW